MTMSNDASVVSITLQAGSNLSAAANLYKFVKLSSDGQIDVVSSAGGDAVGVLYNDPNAAGKAAQVAVAGVVKIQAGATIDEGVKIQSADDGQADVAASGDHVLGVALTAGDAGDIISMLLISHHILA